MSDEDTSNSAREGKSYKQIYVNRSPKQLRKMLQKIKTKLTPGNYLLVVYELYSIVCNHAGQSPVWLKRELTVSLLNELPEYDFLDAIHKDTVAHLINLADSGRLHEIRSDRARCICFGCC